MKEELLNHAIALAAQGLAVFPCREDKRPCRPAPEPGKGGFHEASTDPDDIARLFRHSRAETIGVRTGGASGVSALDVDIRHDGDLWAVRNHERLPKTRTHATPSGGIHLLFRHRPRLDCSVGQIAQGIDVRGDGGYVIWWPAAGLEILNNMPLDQLPPWPDWAVPPPRPEKQRSEPGTIIASGYGVQRLLDFIADSPEGERNNRLHWAACRLRELWFAEPQYRENAISKLLDSAMELGLSEREAGRTIKSALGE